MTSKLTRERIELIANFHRAMALPPSHAEIEELARMALAAMDSEPVAEVLSNRPGNDTSTIDRALPVGTQLYRHAQSAPVVPESISVRQAISALESADAVTTIGQAYKLGWNAYRAAMLQELQKSAGAEATCRSNENVQAVEVQSLTSINPAPDLVSLQKKAESIIGNYPGIPDGCVMVPVEPNGDMLAAAQDAYGETDGDIASTLRAAMLAATQQEGK